MGHLVCQVGGGGTPGDLHFLLLGSCTPSDGLARIGLACARRLDGLIEELDDGWVGGDEDEAMGRTVVGRE